MTYIVTSRGQTHRVEVQEGQRGLVVRLDDRESQVDVLQVGPHHYSLQLDGCFYDLDILQLDGETTVLVNGQPHQVEVRGEREVPRSRRTRRAEVSAGRQAVSAPMPGKVVKLLVRAGQRIGAGEGLVVIEAMKMENELKAAAAGTVVEVRTEEGKTVNGSEVLMVIE